MRVPDLFHRVIFKAFCAYYVFSYYVFHLRHAGLFGRGALEVWHARTFPRPCGGGKHGGPIVWVHAAGPGDAKAAVILIEALYARVPLLQIFVTYGSALARAHLLQHVGGRIYGHHWLSFDCGYSVRWRVKRLQSALYVVHAGRVLAVAFGVPRDRIVVGGDYRLAFLPDADGSRSAALQVRLQIKEDCPLVVLVGPSREEIDLILPGLLDDVKRKRFRLLIAPVELEVRAYIKRKTRKLGAEHTLWSLSGTCLGDVIILDTHGELFHVYGVASAAIIGETFAGGVMPERNFWEPLVQGVPVIAGPYWKPIPAAQKLWQSGVATALKHHQELSEVLDTVLQDSNNGTGISQGLDDICPGKTEILNPDPKIIMALLQNYDER